MDAHSTPVRTCATTTLDVSGDDFVASTDLLLSGAEGSPMKHVSLVRHYQLRSCHIVAPLVTVQQRAFPPSGGNIQGKLTRETHLSRAEGS